MIAERHPVIVGTIIRAIHTEHEVPSLHAIVISQRSVEVDGLKDPEEDEDPYQPRAGW